MRELSLPLVDSSEVDMVFQWKRMSFHFSRFRKLVVYLYLSLYILPDGSGREVSRSK
jgi:hypothetical protein